MTLDSDRPKKNLRPPMSKRTMIIVVTIAIAVLVFAIVVTVGSGQSFF